MDMILFAQTRSVLDKELVLLVNWCLKEEFLASDSETHIHPPFVRISFYSTFIWTCKMDSISLFAILTVYVTLKGFKV